MPQTSYSLDNTIALAGQVVDRLQVEGLLQCSETLEAGVIVEAHAGQLRHAQNTGSGADADPLVGATIYRAAIEPNGFPTITGGEYLSGDYVPVLRKGKIWVKFNGTTPPASYGGALNYNHASDNSAGHAALRGQVTDAAVSAVVGSEISALPSTFRFIESALDLDGNTICLLEVNSP